MSQAKETVEEEIQRKGLTHARVTPERIESIIKGEYYVRPIAVAPDVPELTCLTICVLVLHNGFTVVGESACASPANFNKEIGERIARENAKQKIWALEGYALRNRLSGYAE